MTLFAVLLACGGGREDGGETPASSPSGEIFAEVAEEVGLHFVHFNGMSGEFYYCEILGGGAALFDYDGDGDLDVYLVQGHMLGPGKTVNEALFPPQHPLPLTDRLYRNDLEIHPDGTRTLRFTDVTEGSGIQALGYGMGVAMGDYNNDGWPDLYVTNWGSNQLFRNNGDGTFTDVTAQAGVDDRRWTVAAAFVDYDRDGWLDLYVANYLDFSYASHKQCTNEVGLRDYCGPLSYEPEPDTLFRNRGDGTFEDVTLRSGIGRETPGGALGVVAGDFNGDGWSDVYVANDGLPNHLWMNQGDGTFRNEALLAGCAVNQEGHAEASMGVDAGDYDHDGDEDLIMSHLTKETNTVYRNDGTGFFEDVSVETGLGPPSWEYTGFGAGWIDYDHDGRLDFLVVNGAINAIRELLLAKDPFPLHQRNQLFRNLGEGRFEEVTARAGAAFLLSEVSRGAAFGDLDNDGDLDVVVTNNAGPVRLLLNQASQGRSWLGLRLVGAAGNRDALGAWVGIFRPDGPTLWRRVRTEGSYASARDPRLLFGLGDSRRISRVEVHWPDGTVEEWDPVPLGQYTTLRQGRGRR